MISQDSTDGLEFGMSCALEALLVPRYHSDKLDRVDRFTQKMVRCWTDTNIQRPIGVVHAASNDAAVMDEHASNWSLIDGKCVFCLKRLVSYDAV